MFLSMPVPMQIYAGTESALTCPLTVSEGRQWIREYIKEKGIKKRKSSRPTKGWKDRGRKTKTKRQAFWTFQAPEREYAPSHPDEGCLVSV